MYDFVCPICSSEILIDVFRYNTKTNCPCCNKLIKIEFDFYSGDDNEEFDVYNLIPLDFNNNEYLEYSESKKNDGNSRKNK